MFKFEKLTVWQRAVGFADQVYIATEGFPVEVRFGLTAQLRRAAVSISSSIAEGSARPDSDFARFIGYAAGSLYEVITQATIGRNRAYLTDQVLSEIYHEGEELARMLTGLRDSLV